MLRSSIGAFCRRSMMTKAGRNTAAAMSAGMTSEELQPEMPPLEIP